MYKIILITFLLLAFCVLFAVDEDEAVKLLLSQDYIFEISSLEGVGATNIALKAIGYGLAYIETLEWNYKDRFFDYHDQLNIEELPEDFAYSTDIVETLVATSTVSSINLIDFDKTSNLSKAVALRIYFIDWMQTKDPNSGKVATKFAMELAEQYPESYYPYKVLFYYHSHSSFGSREVFEEYRKKVLPLNPDDAILASVVEGEYNLGMYEELLEDYQRMNIPDDLSHFFAAYANLKLGQVGTAEIILKNTSLSALPKQYASIAYEELGKISEDEGNIDSALFYYRKSIESNSSNRAAMVKLGLAYLKSDDRDKYTLARFYLEMSGMEEYNEEVASTLNYLRRKLVLGILFKQVLPLIAGVVFALIFVEYFFKRRRRKQEERIEKES
ncbi:hypothetical protein AT15_03595 [Kosmotoga arenicorallina S304]|uniref:Uncharacterized protein n=1 Tax=Kosmotoga arenicorallina S304 TaxID=1453497 RepID=A0A176K4B8_9BACT|nr:hypothetical protein [Kosmotoga arenicorallina]OAA31921.1 hypothetical protein AT15_03595 [Kosmotoga arenicorallina S304]